jgi:hypothetical protein
VPTFREISSFRECVSFPAQLSCEKRLFTFRHHLPQRLPFCSEA